MKNTALAKKRQILNGALIAVLTLKLSSCLNVFSPKEFRWAGKTMGTTYHITFYHQNLSASQFALIIKGIEKVLVQINREMSTYDPDSDISKFNKSTFKGPHSLPFHFLKVVQVAQEVFKKSDEAFDITVMPLVNLWGFGPDKKRAEEIEYQLAKVLARVGQKKLQLTGDGLTKLDPHVTIDLSAIAKGYGVDAVARYLEENGIQNYLVEIGGEVRAKGHKAGGENVWQVGIDRPREGSDPGKSFLKVVPLANKSMATSGNYRNYYVKDGKKISHTIDPRTGRPVEHLLASATVIATDCVNADAIATAVMVLGPDKGAQLIESLPRVEALLVSREKGQLVTWTSKNFP